MIGKIRLEKNLFKNLYYVLYILLMFSGSTVLKNFDSQILVLLIIDTFLMVHMNSPKRCALVNKKRIALIPFWFVLLFVLYLIFQYQMAYAPYIVRTYLIRYFVLSFLFIYVPYEDVLYNSIKLSKYYSFIVAISILIVFASLGIKSGGLVGNYQTGGMMMSIGCILFLIDYFNDNNKFDIIGLLMCVLGLMISGKRMFTIIVGIAFVVLYFISNKKNNTGKLIFIVISAITSVSLASIFVPSINEVFNRFLGNSGDVRIITSGRNVLWEKALIAFRENKAFGIGFACFERYFNDNYLISGIGSYLTHNIYIGLLAETGLIGTAIYVGFMSYCLIRTFIIRHRLAGKINPKVSYILIYSILIQLWFIIYGITGNGIYDLNETFMYFFGISIMISIDLRKKYLINK